jgi:Ribbon-helix-helix protein, copG family
MGQSLYMQATVELPEAVVRELEVLARGEGTTTADLIQRIVEAHLARCQTTGERRFTVSLPLIPAAETGPIQPVSGRDVDELLARDHFSA